MWMRERDAANKRTAIILNEDDTAKEALPRKISHLSSMAIR